MPLNRIGQSLSSDRRAASLLVDPSRLELLDLSFVGSLASPISEATRPRRPAHRLEQVLILREMARRTGQVQLLTRAAGLANRAAVEAGAESRLFAAARLQQALCALDSAQMACDPQAAAVARSRLAEAETALGCAPGRLNGPGLIRARLLAAEALAKGDRDAMLDTVAVFDEAIASLDARTRATGAGKAEAAFARQERADLMIGMGVKLKEAGLLHRAARDLDALSARLDANYLPLSWARTEVLRGGALKALGEITAEARLMKDAAAAFRGALDAIPIGHSPYDRARAAHGLALALQAAAEIVGENELYAAALKAFNHALDQLQTPGLPYRAVVTHDRAACLARQAERSGDVQALAAAEAAFKAQLLTPSVGADPVAWAVIQISLARIYESRAELLGDCGERADAAFALAEALDVFAERGLKSLAEIAAAALERLRAPAPRR